MSRLAQGAAACLATLALSISMIFLPSMSMAETGSHSISQKKQAQKLTTFLVISEPGQSAGQAIRSDIRKAGGKFVTQWREIGVSVGATAPRRAQKVVTRLRTMPGVSAAGISGEIKTERPRLAVRRAKRSATTESPGPIAMAAQSVQANQTATGRGVTIAIADTGILQEHEEFAGRFAPKLSGSCTNGGIFRQKPGSWRPSGAAGSSPTHGTQVASVAAAGVNGKGLRGIAPDAGIAAIRVGNDDGNFFPEATICAAMTAVHKRIPIVNHSYGVDFVGNLRHALWNPDLPAQAVAITAVNRAYQYAEEHGVLNVAATGNAGEDHSDKPNIPLPDSESNLPPLSDRMVDLLAQVPGVLGVGEIMPSGKVMASSTTGFGLLDLVAVGQGRLANYPNTYQAESGTSFAAPAVSGAAALVKQLLPSAQPAEIVKILEESATPRNCVQPGQIYSEQPCRTDGNVTNFFGHGELDAARAVQTAMGLRGRGVQSR